MSLREGNILCSVEEFILDRTGPNKRAKHLLDFFKIHLAQVENDTGPWTRSEVIKVLSPDPQYQHHLRIC